VKKLKVTKLKVAAGLSVRLSELGLSHDDMDFLISLGRRIDGRTETLYVFDPALAPVSPSTADRLADVALVVSGGAIIDVRRDAASPDEAGEIMPAAAIDP
jgi:hypothetical protein